MTKVFFCRWFPSKKYHRNNTGIPFNLQQYAALRIESEAFSSFTFRRTKYSTLQGAVPNPLMKNGRVRLRRAGRNRFM